MDRKAPAAEEAVLTAREPYIFHGSPHFEVWELTARQLLVLAGMDPPTAHDHFLTICAHSAMDRESLIQIYALMFLGILGFRKLTMENVRHWFAIEEDPDIRFREIFRRVITDAYIMAITRKRTFRFITPGAKLKSDCPFELIHPESLPPPPPPRPAPPPTLFGETLDFLKKNDDVSTLNSWMETLPPKAPSNSMRQRIRMLNTLGHSYAPKCIQRLVEVGTFVQAKSLHGPMETVCLETINILHPHIPENEKNRAAFMNWLTFLGRGKGICDVVQWLFQKEKALCERYLGEVMVGFIRDQQWLAFQVAIEFSHTSIHAAHDSRWLDPDTGCSDFYRRVVVESALWRDNARESYSDWFRRVCYTGRPGDIAALVWVTQIKWGLPKATRMMRRMYQEKRVAWGEQYVKLQALADWKNISQRETELKWFVTEEGQKRVPIAEPQEWRY
jgi:hypothetical protein